MVSTIPSSITTLLYQEWDPDFNLSPEPTRAEVRRWPKHLREQRKAQLHTMRMARFRNRKTAERRNMLEEHQSLENELAIRLAELHRSRTSSVASQSHVGRNLQQLVLDREALRDENVELRESIASYFKLHRTIQNSCSNLMMPIGDTCMNKNATVRFTQSKWDIVQVQASHQLDFSGGEMPFFYHPFSREEFDLALHLQETKLSMDISRLQLTGELLGWSVYHAPLSNCFYSWSRYSKRCYSSIDAIKDAMTKNDGTHVWPLLTTSRDLGLAKDFSVQTVQEFDEDACVIVRSHPGVVNHRYMGLVQRSKWHLINDQRVLKYALVIVDSKANARSRDAEPTVANNTRWINQGGSFLTLTEVDDRTVDVTFDHWVCADSEKRAQSHFVTFGHLVMQWEQLVAPKPLLTF